MSKESAAKLQEYLTSSQDVNERLKRLISLCSDKRSLSEDEEEVYDKVFKDTFAPLKVENGVEVLDVDKLKENVKAYKEEEAKLKVEKGRETLRWLKYYDSKDNKAPERYSSGRKINMDKAIVATSGLKNEINISYMYPCIVGLCNEILDIPGGKENVSARDVVSDLIKQPYYPTGLFSPEEERLYMIGMLEPEKNMSRTDADKLYFYDSNKENENILEQNKEDADFVKEIINLELPESIEEELNSDLHNYTNRGKYELLDTYHVCKLLSDGKDLNEIEKLRPFKYDDLISAYRDGVIFEGTQKDNHKTEFYRVVTGASKKLNELNHQLFEDGVDFEREEVKKSMEVQENIRNVLEKSKIKLDDYSLLRKLLITKEDDFKIENDRKRTNDTSYARVYGNAFLKRDMDKASLENALAKGGYTDGFVNRTPSILNNAYAFKAIKSADFDQKKPYDSNFINDSGEDFMQFMERNPFNFNKEISEEEKKRNLESVSANADFYRKWAEMNVTRFTFDDYSSKKNIKGHEREIEMMAGFCIDCSQNSQSIRRNFKKEFIEAYGGEKYYEALKNVNGMLQTVTSGARSMLKPNGDIIEKVRWKYYLETAGYECPIEGKNTLELDPNVYCWDRAVYFQTLSEKAISNMTPAEAEAYLNDGTLQDDVKYLLKSAWEKSAEIVPKGLEDDIRLVANTLGIPSFKRDKDILKTGFEDVRDRLYFTEEFIDLLKIEEKSLNYVIENTMEFSLSLPHVESFDKALSPSLVYNALTLSMPVNLSDGEKAKYVINNMKALSSGTEERDHVLDKVCKAIDNFSFANYNLGCLTDKDNGERNNGKASESERDVLGLIKMVKVADSAKQLREMYPDYFEKKYYNISKWRDFSAKLDTLSAVKESLSNKLSLNNVSINSYKTIKQDTKDLRFFSKDQSIVMLNDYAVRCQAAQNLAHSIDSNGVIRFETKNQASAKEVIEELGNSYQKVDTAGISKSLGWGYDESEADKIKNGNHIVHDPKKENLKNLYIDGIRADVYVEPYIEKDETCKDAILRMISEGKHRVESVIPAVDNHGDIIPIIHTIEPITSPSSKDFYLEDPGRAERINAVKADFRRSLGKETQFKFFTSAEDMKLAQSLYDKHKVENYSKTPVTPFDEVAAKYLEKLNKIDSWYHKNSQQFKDIKTALKTPENKQGVIDACNAYIGKYFVEKGTYERATDLGNERMKEILEIKSCFKTELETDNRIAKEKANKKNVEREQINIEKEDKQGESKSSGGLSKMNKDISRNRPMPENEGEKKEEFNIFK